MTAKALTPRLLTYASVAPHLSWPGVVAALRDGHHMPRAEIRDVFLGRDTGTMVSRSAHIPGLGFGAKTFTVFDGNAARGLPTVQGAMLVFAPEDGRLTAIVENALVTRYKTAADSVLGASLLARPESRELLILGAGTVAESLIEAYAACFPGLRRISLWARRTEQAEALARKAEGAGPALQVVSDLPAAVATADIIATATMAREPILRGEWVRPGTHVDLIGAYKADMREADDALIAGASVFVDSRETTLGHIGELLMPIASGALRAEDVLGDLYDLVQSQARRRQSDAEITLFKNGGGAHLDLMTAHHIAGVMAGRG